MADSISGNETMDDMELDMSEYFVPPVTEKIKKIGKKEKIPAYMFVDPDDPNIIFIRTNDNIKILDNSKYEIIIKDLEFEDGDIQNIKEEVVTELTPCYVNYEDVLTLCNGINIPKEDIMHHARTASEIVEYWAYKHEGGIDDVVKFNKETIKDEYYPFYVYVKYKTALEAVREFYIGAVTRPEKFRDQISDLQREEKMNLDAIKDLIDDLEDIADDWLNQIITITADPQWALRGKYSMAISFENFKPYHETYINKKGGSWGRGY